MGVALVSVGARLPRASRAVATEYYRTDLDGLRGVAVIAVIGFHAFPDLFPGGFVGVDVFFVISGYLISRIILRELEHSTFTISGFYARRARRILPALLLTLAATLAFGSLALLPDEFARLGEHVAAAATFAINFLLWHEQGYFDVAAQSKPLLHLWSLGVEEQFYLAWPLVLLMLRRGHRNPVSAILLITLSSLAMATTIGQQHGGANFYLPFSRFWELGLGCLIAALHHSPRSYRRLGRSLSGPFGTVLPVAGIALIAASVLFLPRHRAFPDFAALFPVVGAACVVAVREGSWFRSRVFGNRALVWVGLISYPLYLWHWPMLSFAAILADRTPRIEVRITAIALSVLLAWLTFSFVERPVRARRGMRIPLALAGCLVALAAAGFVVRSTEGLAGRFDFNVNSIRPGPRIDALCRRSVSDRFFNFCKRTDARRPLAVVLGDSRAQAIYDGIVSATGPRYSFALLARGGCPPMLDVRPGVGTRDGCNAAWRFFVRYVAEVRPAVVIVVGGNGIERSSVASRDLLQRAFRENLRALIVALQAVTRVIYIRQFPEYSTSPSCFLRPIRFPGIRCRPQVPLREIQANLGDYDHVVDQVRAALPQLRVVDSIPILCGATECSQRLRSGTILYRDEVHLSPVGAQYFVRAAHLVATLLHECCGLRDRRPSVSRVPAHEFLPADAISDDNASPRKITGNGMETSSLELKHAAQNESAAEKAAP